jgi:hypothetical protein
MSMSIAMRALAPSARLLDHARIDASRGVRERQDSTSEIRTSASYRPDFQARPAEGALWHSPAGTPTGPGRFAMLGIATPVLRLAFEETVKGVVADADDLRLATF